MDKINQTPETEHRRKSSPGWLRPNRTHITLMLRPNRTHLQVIRVSRSLIETPAALDFEIQEAQQTLERIEQTTWGVKLVEVAGRRFAILPESTPENPLGIMDGQPAVRLSSE